MDIKNFTQFADCLIKTQSVHLHSSFNSLVMCMMVYNSLCACGGKSNQDKSNKHSECNRIYRQSLGSVDSIKAYLFQITKDNIIRFYIDDTYLVKTIIR